MEISNKVAIVTGGIGGIGIVTVQHILKNGAKYVAIFDVLKPDEDSVTSDLNELKKEFNKEKFGYYQCDVTNSDQFEEDLILSQVIPFYVKKISNFISYQNKYSYPTKRPTAQYKKLMREQEYIDILINNAGIGNQKKVDLMIDVNFRAVIKCSLTALKYMAITEGGKGGVIVNISSTWGLVDSPRAPLYCATKHAVVSFVRSMKAYNKQLGVRILCLCPGYTRTKLTKLESTHSFGLEITDKILSDIAEPLAPYLQQPNNVGKGIVKIIKEGEGGDVWVAQNDEPAFIFDDKEHVESTKLLNVV